ncbi:MAG: hypothetical protein RL616_827 [Verrucomicrobiota bacterium]
MNETKNEPPILGILWRHEIPFVALIAFAIIFATSPEHHGAAWPVPCFGAAIIAGVVLLALRCRAEWAALPNKFFFFGLAAAWVTLFVFLGNSTFGYLDTLSIFSWVFDTYTAPESDSQFGVFMPFVVLGLFWWKRAELSAAARDVWWPGLLLVGGALLLHLVGYVIQQPRLSMISFLLGLYGLTGLAWGRRWLRASLFPFFLLVFCVPTAGTDWLAFKMRLLVSWIVEHIAHLGLAPDLVRDGTQLFDSQHRFAYEVAAACSGIRSLTALLALTTIYGFVTFKKPWQRAAMIASSFPLAIAGNVLRLCFTIMVAELGGQDAGKAVETKAGLVTFLVAIAGVYFLGRWLEKVGNKKPQPTQP